LAGVLVKSGSATVRCIGESMEPTVARGANVTIERCNAPRSGDVVLFRSGDELVLHRVLWCTPFLDRFAHVGDRPGARAGISSPANIIGRARLPRRVPGLSTQWRGLWRIAESAAARLRRGIN